ncbi:PAS sensor protein [Halobiforma nitratireducens JCM 10879]|uniref:histidine kinase n=1 Tax=Halobiforma nitratireducens JCM 10879 TaxID=1227454 RepID=M0M451_9EURY|nr:PAS sensor protein [Halobiforma nitratireducens JCM 10879]
MAGAQEASSPFGLTVTTADGERRRVELQVSLLVEEGQFHGVVGVTRTILESDDQRPELESGRESYETITSVLNEAEVGVFVLDEEFEVAWIDETAERYFGLDREEVIGRDKRDLIRETIQERVADGDRFADTVLATYDDNNYVEHFECRITAGDDREERWLEHRSKPLESGRYAGGRVELYYDITDQYWRAYQLRQLNQAVREWLQETDREAVAERASRHLQTMLNLEINGVFLYDETAEELQPAAWSTPAETLFGELPTFAEGEGIAWRVFESEQPEVYDDVREAPDIYDPETPARSEIVLPIGDHGVVIIGSTEQNAFGDNDVMLAKVVASSLESTFDRIRHERRLEHERRLTGQILEAMPVGTVVLDADATITRINERARELLDVTDLDTFSLGDRPVYDETGEQLSVDERPFARTLATGEPIYDHVLQVERAAGGRRWLSVNAVPITDETGEIIRVITTQEDITPLKEHERELETELREIFGRISDAVYALDDEYRFTHVNRRAEELLGYTEDELLGERLWEVFPEEAGNAEIRGRFETAMETQEPTSIEQYSDLLEFWVEATLYPSESGISVYFRDVTDRKEREQQLEQHRALTEAANDVIVTIDTDSTIQMVNPAVEDVFGYMPDELVGQSLTRLMPDELADRHRAALVQYLETGEQTLDWNYIELPGVRKDGTEIPLAISFSEVEHEGDQYFTGILRDVTDRKEREAELERRARQQQVVADLGQFALETDDLDDLMHEAAGRVADVLDNEYCKVLDLDPNKQELLLRQGVGWREGIVGTATVAADDNSQAGYTLLSEEPVVVDDLDAETRFSGPELLTSHDVSSGISTIIGSVEEPWGILGTHDVDRREFTDEDVTFVQSVANVLAAAIERHRYQEDLEQLVDDLERSNERLERFAYAASHDLQEPLRMVSSYLQLIERRYEDELDTEGREFLEFAVDGADRMREMIDALLEYSRIQTQGDPFEPVDLNAVLADVRENLQIQISESNASITAETLPVVEGDANQLRQVFQNLLANAIEYSGDAPPQIHVSAERDGAEWIISVRDEGIGIDPDHATRIFEVFERLHTQDEHDGTGIGLALCERIVERHGGEIWVDSELDEGATFSFTLPGADDPTG